MTAKTIVITGASDGIGAAAASALAKEHHVVIVGRSPTKTAEVARCLEVPFHLADFARLDDVMALGATLNTAYPQIDVLVHNAGAIFGESTVTIDGFEANFQVNHLAHHLLTSQLRENVTATGGSILFTSSISARAVRRVNVAHQHLPIPKGNYHPLRAYAAAKLAALAAMYELHLRYGIDGSLRIGAFHPGLIGSAIASDLPGIVGRLDRTRLRKWLASTPEKGAKQLVHLATTDDWPTGEYFERGRVRTDKITHLANRDFTSQVWDHAESLLTVRAKRPKWA